jgi:hypothetical protein
VPASKSAANTSTTKTIGMEVHRGLGSRARLLWAFLEIL